MQFIVRTVVLSLLTFIIFVKSDKLDQEDVTNMTHVIMNKHV